MKVTVCFDNLRVVVPCGDGTLPVRELMRESILRYRKATGKTDGPSITSLSSLTGGGLLDPDDRLCDVADDREQIVAHFTNESVNHAGGDGASSVGTNSPDFFNHEVSTNPRDQRRYATEARGRIYNAAGTTSAIKRESVKRLSMHALSTREPHVTAYSALSLPRETRRREPLGQDSKICQEFPIPRRMTSIDAADEAKNSAEDCEIREIVVKNEAGPLGLHVVPCYDLAGNDQGLRVEGIEPNGRIAKDGQIDLHDRIIRINGNNLLRIPFSKVQNIFASCMSDSCLRITVLKHEKNVRKIAKNTNINGSGNNNNNNNNDKNTNNNINNREDDDDQRLEKIDNDDSVKKLQCHNILQTSNTRKIGRMIEIELTKGTNGLGFSVTTRDNPAGGHCPIYIKNILPKGAAVEDSRLRPGDRLLEVNKIEMTGKSQSEVVSLLRSIPSGGKVRMIVSRQEDITSNAESAGQSKIGSFISAESTPDVELNAAWSPETRSLTSRGIIKTNSSATHENAEKRHDEIVKSCNNSSVESRWETKSQACSSVEKFWEKTLPCKINEPNNDERSVSPRKNRIVLTLDIPVHDSEKAGLGVSVKGKTSQADETTNMDLGIFIKSVLNGGAASRDGRLRTNDQLLNVNGVSLLGLSNSEAMETLRRAMLNTNSSITGVISLTIARRVSTSYASEKYPDSAKILTPNGVYNGETLKFNDGRVRERNSFNAKIIKRDSPGYSSSNVSPWNPVIDRLTEQYNKNSLRNESYCLATNKTWLNSVSNVKKLMLGGIDNTDTLHEESNELVRSSNKSSEDRQDENPYSGDPSYDSQLSLEDGNMGANKFSRDALGRQSMSEKRHAALDAKNTDTYKRNKKVRDGRQDRSGEIGSTRDGKNAEDTREHQQQQQQQEQQIRVVKMDEKIGQNGVRSIVSGGSSSSRGDTEEERKHTEDYKGRRQEDDYVYGISGCNEKFTSPRKHWLVDDDTSTAVKTAATSNNTSKDEREGFTNIRGDVKQASLNSALDERYKRSRKKGGIRSMLRLGKNRKSLNFGDNTENRHESSNYCSGTINYIA